MAQIITINKEDEFFPEAFKAIGEDCPERIYAMGNLDLLKREQAWSAIRTGLTIRMSVRVRDPARS